MLSYWANAEIGNVLWKFVFQGHENDMDQQHLKQIWNQIFAKFSSKFWRFSFEIFWSLFICLWFYLCLLLSAYYTYLISNMTQCVRSYEKECGIFVLSKMSVVDEVTDKSQNYPHFLFHFIKFFMTQTPKFFWYIFTCIKFCLRKQLTVLFTMVLTLHFRFSSCANSKISNFPHFLNPNWPTHFCRFRKKVRKIITEFLHNYAFLDNE